MSQKLSNIIMEFEFSARFRRIYNRFEKRLGETESRLSNMIEKSKADIIKWMFIFWTGTVITILGGLFGFLQLFFGK